MTPTLAVMIGLAVAIDYSLFIVSRFKHEVSVSGNREEAAGRAVGTAGSAVVFAGLTVIIALVALRVVGIKFLSDMGMAAAFAVFVAVLVALTFLPAFLGLLGRKVFAGKVPFVKAPDPEAADAVPGPAARYAGWVARKPAIPLIIGIAILGALALPATGLKLALAVGEHRRPRDQLAAGLRPGVRRVRSRPQRPTARRRRRQGRHRPGAGGLRRGGPDHLRAGRRRQRSDRGDEPGGRHCPGPGDPGSAPTDEKTIDLMQSIRDGEGALNEQIGVHYGVTGQTALETDVSDRLLEALVPYLIIVVGLAFILLMLVFRSILVPLTAALGPAQRRRHVRRHRRDLPGGLGRADLQPQPWSASCRSSSSVWCSVSRWTTRCSW